MQPTFQLALLVWTFMFASLNLYKTPKLDACHNAYNITKHNVAFRQSHYWSCTPFRPLCAVCLVVHLNKHIIDNKVCMTSSYVLLTHFYVAFMYINFCFTHSRNHWQPPLESPQFQLHVYANIRPLWNQQMGDACVFIYFKNKLFDKDKYNMSLEFHITKISWHSYLHI